METFERAVADARNLRGEQSIGVRLCSGIANKAVLSLCTEMGLPSAPDNLM